MTNIAPSRLIQAQAWGAQDMTAKSNWKFHWPSTWESEVRALDNWAAEQNDSINNLQKNSIATPEFDQLAIRVKRELELGSGVAWIHGEDSLDESTLNLLFLKISLAMGKTINTYGRLYGIRDTGKDYTSESIPVSQTNAPTGVHTDSSQRTVLPKILGLCCIMPAVTGGKSKIVSASQVHEKLRQSAPQKLEILYKDYIRDLVTPGSEKNIENIQENHFPIFKYSEDKLTIRYMRYWIEKGQERIGKPLSSEVTSALDALDIELNSEENTLSFYMERGDIIFVDNTRILHDRDGFIDTPEQKRVYTRVWIDQSEETKEK
ncbi:TauD/TfdA family dioxygenase [Microbulbifer sp. OS29]|uniref:TauD/TfdA family dioxygenase n=1 Tax=Microbulbifer okhotskensis TaxID=2926617 RepID=A0A9X2EKQ6_9GAMM|nr:TauD/TfdA family dioxygenase [Microbulbifer okhotskensis]MCO1334009.1 TauD/TfdA family dioxygenase [Microbulbifer okhotskensis]